MSRSLLIEAGGRIVAFYDAAGQSENAAAWRAKLAEVPPQLPADVFARP